VATGAKEDIEWYHLGFACSHAHGQQLDMRGTRNEEGGTRMLKRREVVQQAEGDTIGAKCTQWERATQENIYRPC